MKIEDSTTAYLAAQAKTDDVIRLAKDIKEIITDTADEDLWDASDIRDIHAKLKQIRDLTERIDELIPGRRVA